MKVASSPSEQEAPQRAHAITPRTGLLIVAGVFVASRLVYHLIGVRFDTSPLEGYWQYADPELLRDDLFRTLWNLHVQPPGYNLLLGLVLEGAGGNYAGAFHAVYLGAGLALAFLLYALLVRIGTQVRWAALVAAGFAAAPPAVLYETWLYPEYLVTVLLLASALALHALGSSRRTTAAVAAFSAMGAVVLIRTLFHPVWLLAIVGLAWLVCRPSRRQVLIGAALPVALVLGVVLKNWVQVGVLGTSSCFGLNAARISLVIIDDAEKRELVREGVLSELAPVSLFELPVSQPELFTRKPPTGVPVLDQTIKSTGGVNLNHSAYPGICRTYQDDAVAVLRHRPGTTLVATRTSALVYFRPSSDFHLFFADNRDAVSSVERVASLAFGQLREAPKNDVVDFRDFDVHEVPQRLLEVGWLLVGAYAAAVVLGVAALRRLVKAGAWSSPLALVIGFALFNIVYVSLVGNLAEAGENNRFRFLVDPLAIVVLAAAWRVLRRPVEPSDTTSPSG